MGESAGSLIPLAIRWRIATWNASALGLPLAGGDNAELPSKASP
jgi:hypothetical protein